MVDFASLTSDLRGLRDPFLALTEVQRSGLYLSGL